LSFTGVVRSILEHGRCCGLWGTGGRRSKLHRRGRTREDVKGPTTEPNAARSHGQPPPPPTHPGRRGALHVPLRTPLFFIFLLHFPLPFYTNEERSHADTLPRRHHLPPSAARSPPRPKGKASSLLPRPLLAASVKP
jgi:hypothetical protein